MALKLCRRSRRSHVWLAVDRAAPHGLATQAMNILRTFTLSAHLRGSTLYARTSMMEDNQPILPRMIVEDELQTCICGDLVTFTWDIAHSQCDAEPCLERVCTNCWSGWMWSQADHVLSSDHLSCICNRGTVTLAAIQFIMPKDDFSR